MPYDKNGKYYRKPVYKIEKIKKDLPPKKRRHFRFYIFGLITPYVSIFYYFSIAVLLAYLAPTLNAKFLLILSVLALIPFMLIFYRFHKSQVRNYLKQGGKLTKKKIVLLNTLWWITTFLILIIFFAAFALLFFPVPGS